MSISYAPRLNVLGHLITLENEKSLDYLSKFFKSQQIEDKGVSQNLIKKEK